MGVVMSSKRLLLEERPMIWQLRNNTSKSAIVDKNDSPNGYDAVIDFSNTSSYKDSCSMCQLSVKNKEVCHTWCSAEYRKDGKHVIFRKYGQ